MSISCGRGSLTILLAALVCGASPLHAQVFPGAVPARRLDPEAGLSVVLIGTGIPLPNAHRALADTLLAREVLQGMAAGE